VRDHTLPLHPSTAVQLGVLAEFRGDWAAALRMFREAYGYLSQVTGCGLWVWSGAGRGVSGEGRQCGRGAATRLRRWHGGVQSCTARSRANSLTELPPGFWWLSCPAPAGAVELHGAAAAVCRGAGGGGIRSRQGERPCWWCMFTYRTDAVSPAICMHPICQGVCQLSTLRLHVVLPCNAGRLPAAARTEAAARSGGSV
jgi:hypothetical protein